MNKFNTHGMYGDLVAHLCSVKIHKSKVSVTEQLIISCNEVMNEKEYFKVFSLQTEYFSLKYNCGLHACYL